MCRLACGFSDEMFTDIYIFGVVCHFEQLQALRSFESGFCFLPLREGGSWHEYMAACCSLFTYRLRGSSPGSHRTLTLNMYDRRININNHDRRGV